MPRAKPFKYTYEKEIVMYAYFRRLDYFSTECIYAPNAYRCDTITYMHACPLPGSCHVSVAAMRGRCSRTLRASGPAPS